MKTVPFLLLISFLLSLHGCGEFDLQKSYKIGSQSNLDDDDDDDGTPTPTATTTATPTPTSSTTPTPTATATPTSTPTATPTTSAITLSGATNTGDNNNIFDSLASETASARLADNNAASATNWLGKAYTNEPHGLTVDTDKDGYIDQLEIDRSTDPLNGSSVPAVTTITTWSSRTTATDSDLDGLLNREEVHGLDANNPDTDGDGVRDGAEVVSDSSPLDPNSLPQDSDGDGLSNNFENKNNLDPTNTDTDADGLSDDLELFLKSNPRIIDSDYDGITDGREYVLGSDPIVSDVKN